ncbi:toprim domain-containing protein [Adhaeribacter rhizoryzae]|uniref:DNA primase n=1 Tax=Adhaeribacter rhizoryzae TaxID=2607907 RepID=A0A5M6DKP0_9BACT|nr:toprim domain-containing protein [Adhaeribacter rhizoryzae]KAA5548107.1 DNA primase [Adhaeribacter rhizoryzae]
METRKQSASCAEARQIDLVGYLAQLGHHPVKVKNQDYWYLSPLREEKTPSFKVNQKHNCWYDHGLGQGGNLIDFAIRYHGCTVSELLHHLPGTLSVQGPAIIRENVNREANEHSISILKERPLWSFFLCRYVQQRCITLDLAKKYCQEISYQLKDKEYVAIGFRNDAGGYELRHPYFKISSSPKGITTFQNGAPQVAVFEGFFDFLSYLKVLSPSAQRQMDFLVLNSISFFEKARLFLEQHQTINLYLDRDAAGLKITQKALDISLQYHDKSALYRPCKDLNEWLINQGKTQRKSLKNNLH